MITDPTVRELAQVEAREKAFFVWFEACHERGRLLARMRAALDASNPTHAEALTGELRQLEAEARWRWGGWRL
jgi:hypothetical protein